MVIQDFEGRTIPERFKNHQILLEWLQKIFLAHNRIDQIWTFFLKDRHIEKVGKDNYIIARNYDFDCIKNFTEGAKRKKCPKDMI